MDKWIKELEDEENQENEQVADEKEKNTLSTSQPFHPLLWMIENFWLRARIKLYPHESFDSERTRAILNFIWETVYLKFQGNRDWQQFHRIALRRLDMVERWLLRKPKRWIPIAEIYFDPLNTTNGFSNTWQWYLKAITLRKKIETQVMLKGYSLEWKNLERGENPTTPVRLLQSQQRRIASEPEMIKGAYLQLLQHRIHHLSHAKEDSS